MYSASTRKEFVTHNRGSLFHFTLNLYAPYLVSVLSGLERPRAVTDESEQW